MSLLTDEKLNIEMVRDVSNWGSYIDWGSVTTIEDVFLQVLVSYHWADFPEYYPLLESMSRYFYEGCDEIEVEYWEYHGQPYTKIESKTNSHNSVNCEIFWSDKETTKMSVSQCQDNLDSWFQWTDVGNTDYTLFSNLHTQVDH